MLKRDVNWYEFGEYRLDTTNGQLFRLDFPVSLTQKSYEILRFFVENRGRILKKEELLDSLWEGSFVEEANLTQHIYMLRKALRQNRDENVFIETIPKNGYRFIADVREIDNTYASPVKGNGSTGKEHRAISPNGSQQGYVQISTSDKPSGKRLTNYFESLGIHLSRRTIALFASLIGFLFVSAAVAGFAIVKGRMSAGAGGDIRNKSIAVLPFKQIDDEKDAKLGIGIADVLIARLAHLDEIDVRPTTSIIRFEGKDNSDLFDVGTKLGVDCIIEGAIQRDGNKVRVTARLYDVSEKRSIWTEKFDEDYSDTFTLQDRITEKLTQRISTEIPGRTPVSPFKQYTKNEEAYRAYSMGLSYWSMHTKPGFLNAVQQFQKAVSEDPEFASAYAYLADTYAHTGYMEDIMTAEEARAKGTEAAKRALEIDPDNAEAMAALALIYANEDRRTEAFDLMKRSLEIKPNDAHSRHRISWMYANKGQIDRALEEMHIAQKLDPQSGYLNIYYAELLLLARKPEEALKSINKALEIEPGSLPARWNRVAAYEQLGQLDKAESELPLLIERTNRDSPVLLVASRVYAKNNKRQLAQELINEVIKRDDAERYDYLMAFAEIALGKKPAAVQRMRRVIERTGDNIYTIKYESKLDPIRADKLFAKSLKEKEEFQAW
ncbi:MAG: winged helix-turn-helix domain-containing protein [Pyrinomonadaceae bacterium]